MEAHLRLESHCLQSKRASVGWMLQLQVRARVGACQMQEMKISGWRVENCSLRGFSRWVAGGRWKKSGDQIDWRSWWQQWQSWSRWALERGEDVNTRGGDFRTTPLMEAVVFTIWNFHLLKPFETLMLLHSNYISGCRWAATTTWWNCCSPARQLRSTPRMTRYSPPFLPYIQHCCKR